MVHVPLALVDADGVEHLLHTRHGERRDAQHLGLAPLEQPGAVSGGDHTDLGRERTDVGRAAPVDARALVDDAVANDVLLERPERLLDLTGAVGELPGRVGRARELLDDLCLELVRALLARRLVGDLHRLFDLASGCLLDGGIDVVVVVPVHVVRDRLDRAARFLVGLAQLELQVDRRADPALRRLEAVGDELLGDLRRALLVQLARRLGAARLDHHDRDVTVVERTAGDNDLEGRAVAFRVAGVRDPGAVEVGEAHHADRAVERDAAHIQRGRRAVDRRDVVRVLEVDAEDRRDDLHLVAEPLGERRP